MATIKQRRPILEFGDQGEIRYVHHLSGAVSCAPRKELLDRARTCWRRNPLTGRLEMHWQAARIERYADVLTVQLLESGDEA